MGALRVMFTFVVVIAVLASLFSEAEAKKATKDYYKLLGLTKEAKTADIRRAYRKLALKYHPDKNKEKDAEKRWLEFTQAYEVLNDKEKRSRYDRFGDDGSESNQGGGGGFNGEGFSFQFDDIFGGSPFEFGGDDTFFEMPFGSHHQHFQHDGHHHQQQQQHDPFDHYDPFEDMMGGNDMHFGQDHGHHYHHGDDMDFHGGGGDGLFDDFGFGDDLFGGGGGGGGGGRYSEAANSGGGGHGERCRTVTQRVGNMVTTQTICS